MAAAVDSNPEQVDVKINTWDNCPSELLLIIFEMMPAPTLATCMFVNSRWKTLVEYVVEHKNKWKEIINTIINKASTFILKSKATLTWQWIFHNYILWNNIHRAKIILYKVQAINIRMINIYRDYLIVVTNINVRYYHVKNFKLLRTLEMTCRDFLENDSMIVKVQELHDKYDRYFKLHLYKKASINDFNIDSSNVIIVDKIIFYKVEGDRCYALDRRNTLFIYLVVYPNGWVELFSARYYGNPHDSYGINVFENEVYLMASGSILWADQKARCFRKMFGISVPLSERTQTVSCQMFHRYGFVFGVSEKENRKIERYTLFKNNVFVYKLPKLSCMTQHGDILFLGYLDGTIEFVSPRDLSKTKPLRTFNIRDFNRNTDDLEIIAIDVHEDIGIQHLYIATHTQIYHLHITHPNCEDYMWSKYPNLVSLVVDKSVEGLAFKYRTEIRTDVINEMVEERKHGAN